ncbi:MAG: peptidylprolyl isomerase [Actinomycetota bacterium]
MRHPRLLLLLVLALVLFAAACGSDGDGDPSASTDAGTESSSTTQAPATSAAPTTTAPTGPPIATFAGISVTASQIESFAEQIGQSPSATLEIWLLTTGLEAVLAEGGRTISEIDLVEADLSLATIEGEVDPLLRRANAVFVAARNVAEEEVAALADTLPTPEVVCSSHILLETEEEAIEVAALAQGGGDFAALAMEYSTGPSGPRGGDLGCAATAAYVAEYGDGARANGVGITNPVQSQFGWHVIQVRSIGEGTTDVHAELTQEEADAFLLDAANNEVTAYLNGLSSVASEVVGRDAAIDAAYGVWNVDLARLEG